MITAHIINENQHWLELCTSLCWIPRVAIIRAALRCAFVSAVHAQAARHAIVFQMHIFIVDLHVLVVQYSPPPQPPTHTHTLHLFEGEGSLF